MILLVQSFFSSSLSIGNSFGLAKLQGLFDVWVGSSSHQFAESDVWVSEKYFSSQNRDKGYGNATMMSGLRDWKCLLAIGYIKGGYYIVHCKAPHICLYFQQVFMKLWTMHWTRLSTLQISSRRSSTRRRKRCQGKLILNQMTHLRLLSERETSVCLPD